LAISKERKNELIAQYQEWLKRSQAAFVAEYTGLTVKNLDDLRRTVREKGGAFHVAKNTLMRMACKDAGLSVPDTYFEGSTAIGFAFEDVPGLAKTLTEFSRTSEKLKVKGGFMGAHALSAGDVKALADLPPLPVVRAQLIGTLQAPASKLARLLAEPGRQVAAVLQAHATEESPA